MLHAEARPHPGNFTFWVSPTTSINREAPEPVPEAGELLL